MLTIAVSTRCKFYLAKQADLPVIPNQKVILLVRRATRYALYAVYLKRGPGRNQGRY